MRLDANTHDMNLHQPSLLARVNVLAFVPYSKPRLITCIEHHRITPGSKPRSAIRGPDSNRSDWEGRERTSAKPKIPIISQQCETEID